jgi:hypothetical protein
MSRSSRWRQKSKNPRDKRPPKSPPHRGAERSGVEATRAGLRALQELKVDLVRLASAHDALVDVEGKNTRVFLDVLRNIDHRLDVLRLAVEDLVARAARVDGLGATVDWSAYQERAIDQRRKDESHERPALVRPGARLSEPPASQDLVVFGD